VHRGSEYPGYAYDIAAAVRRQGRKGEEKGMKSGKEWREAVESFINFSILL